MAASALTLGSLRSPALLTRSWCLTPSHLTYQLPRPKLRQSQTPYQITGLRADGLRSKMQNSKPSQRGFHNSSRQRSAKSSAIPHISVHIAASSSGKGGKFNPDKSTFDYDPESQPALGLQQTEHTIYQKRRSRPDSGQDAYFVARVGQDGRETAFGICDGVGGWTDHGVNPADFSHGLCGYMAKAAMDWQPTSGEVTKLKPQQLLEMGYQGTIRDPQIKAGGSTACVAITDDEGRMRIANLGDSGYVQLRLGTVQHYSNPQTHAFNTPYQMSLTPPEILAQAMIFGGLPLNDLPERADLADHALQHGDVLVLATDGLWDNLSSQDILSLVSNHMRQVGAWEETPDRGYVVGDKLPLLVNKQANLYQKEAPEDRQGVAQATLQSALAAMIVGEAKSASLNRKRDGPFAKAWQKQMPYDPYHGGKVDDIAVLVVIPVDNTMKKNDDGDAQIKAKL